jgi:DNA-binding beta-propeller fold protein YncE
VDVIFVKGFVYHIRSQQNWLRLRQRCRWAASLMVLVFMAISGAGGHTSNAEPAKATSLVWPLPPERTRIVYRHSFSDATDLGWKRAWWHKVIDWVMMTGDPSRLIQPYAVAVDDHWRIIVADVGAHEVKIFDPANHSVLRIRSYKKYQFIVPIALAVDDQENIYVADSGAGRVVKFSPEGKFLAFIGGEEGGFKQPAGLAYSRKDKLLYVVDTMRPKIFVYDTNGNLVRYFGKRGLGPAEFNYPTFITVDSQGLLYVNDTLNFRIQVLTPDGKFVRQLGSFGDRGGEMARSKGLALDSEGHLYVADALFSTVQMFDQQGRFLLNFGQEGTNPGEFYIPAGVTIDPLDYVYVADPYHRRVEVFHYVAERPPAAQPPSPAGAQPPSAAQGGKQ